ncbi:MAG: hypothetical protein EBR67_03725 [Proteobacteria bacterium]|nr:hypothetical protein [Pseudomonadota bacterium]
MSGRIDKLYYNLREQGNNAMLWAASQGQVEEVARLTKDQYIIQAVSNAYTNQVDVPFYKSLISGSDAQIYNSMMRVKA